MKKPGFAYIMLLGILLLLFAGCDSTQGEAPTVEGGGPYYVDEDHGFESMTVRLSLNASDPDGDALTYQWTLRNAPDYSSLNNSDSSTPTFHAPPEIKKMTDVVVDVEVRDEQGNRATDTVTIVVSPYEERAHKYMPTLKFEGGDYATYFPVDCAFDGDYDALNDEENYDEKLGEPAEPLWVYIHEVEVEGLTYIEYWYYYVFNNYIIPHYSDWEVMIVVLDTDYNPQKIRFGSHGIMSDFIPSEVEWEGTHPIAYVEEGSHAMDINIGTFPGGNPLHDWEGVGYTAHWNEFKEQHTFFGEWYYDYESDYGNISVMQAGGYSYRNYTMQEANDGLWPGEYFVSTPWSGKDIWNNPTPDYY